LWLRAPNQQHSNRSPTEMSWRRRSSAEPILRALESSTIPYRSSTWTSVTCWRVRFLSQSDGKHNMGGGKATFQSHLQR